MTNIPADFFDRPAPEQKAIVIKALLADEDLCLLHHEAKLRKSTGAFHGLLAGLAGEKLEDKQQEFKLKELLLYEIRDNFPPDSPHLDTLFNAWSAQTDRITKDRILRVFRKIGGPKCQELLDRSNGVTPGQRADSSAQSGKSKTFQVPQGAGLVTALEVRLDEQGRVITEWSTSLPDGTVASVTVRRLLRPVRTPEEADDAVEWGSNPKSLPATGGVIVQSEPAVVDGQPYTPGPYMTQLDVYVNPHWQQPAELAPFLAKQVGVAANVTESTKGEYELSVPVFFSLPLEP